MSVMNDDGIPIYRPKPRRPFDLTPLTSSSTPTSVSESKSELPAWMDEPLSPTPGGSLTPNDFTKRTKSVLNLTASTLFGIYSHTYSDGTEPPTPSLLSRTNSQVNVSDTTMNGLTANGMNGNGTLRITTNGTAYSSKDRPDASKQLRRRGQRTPIPQLILRLSALLVFGIGYGVIVMHLHNTKTFTPAWWKEIEGYNFGYLLIWGLVGVGLGSLLPWIDYFLEESKGRTLDGDSVGAGGMVDWMQVVRSIGAFVGIAYAIVCYPPQFLWLQG